MFSRRKVGEYGPRIKVFLPGPVNSVRDFSTEAAGSNPVWIISF